MEPVGLDAAIARIRGHLFAVQAALHRGQSDPELAQDGIKQAQKQVAFAMELIDGKVQANDRP